MCPLPSSLGDKLNDSVNDYKWLTHKDWHVGIKFERPSNSKFFSPNYSYSELMRFTINMNYCLLSQKLKTNSLPLIKIVIERMTIDKLINDNNCTMNTLNEEGWPNEVKKAFLWSCELHPLIGQYNIIYGDRNYYIIRRDIKINNNEIIYMKALIISPKETRNADSIIVHRILNSVELLERENGKPRKEPAGEAGTEFLLDVKSFR
jgi:hypothetical protein